MLRYFLRKVAIHLENDINLHILNAGHKKNTCDGALAPVELELKMQRVVSPVEMKAVVNNS